MNTPPNLLQDTPVKLVDQAASSADSAIRSTQRMANEALDNMAGSVKDLRNEAVPLIDRAGQQVSNLAHRSAQAVRDRAQHLRDSAESASHRTVGYIKDEPVKAMLIAAATGAALMALLSLLNHSRHRS